MRNILRRPRTRGVVVAAVLAGGLVCGLVATADADVTSTRNQTAAPSVASSAPTAEVAEAVVEAEAATCSTTYLSIGSTGTCVRLLQKNLGGLAVDGVYGSGTRSRVRSFQDDTGLTVDGKVGPQTWAKLRRYGKALGWVAGVTVYMCKASSTKFRYAAWNNSGKTAYWIFHVSPGDFFGAATVFDDRIAIQGTIAAGARESEELTVWLASDPEQSTTKLRNFSRNTLPACG